MHDFQFPSYGSGTFKANSFLSKPDNEKMFP